MLRFGLIVVLVIILIFDQAHSQKRRNFNPENMPKIGIIKGRVIEKETGKPLSYSNILVFAVKNDSLVTGAISDKDGNFKVTEVPFGHFYLLVKFIGYEKKKVNSIKITPREKRTDLGTIELAMSSLQTEGVEVVAEKPHVEYKMDKKIVNVSRDIVAQGGSAVTALENVPSVDVDIEGNVSLRGSSNFTVFINGKPSVLQGSDALEQIPAVTIENIEIITNPSAKYDPDGIGGIINVILKKDHELGLTGIFDISAGTGDKYKTNLLVNYQISDFTIFGGVDFTDNKRTGEGNSEQIYYQDTNTHFETEMNGRRIRSGYSFKAGIGYNIAGNSVISIEGKYGSMKFERTHFSDLHKWWETGDSNAYFKNNNIISRNRDYYSINLDFMHKFNDRGHSITALAYFSDKEGGGGNIQKEFLTDVFWNLVEADDNRINSNEDEESNDYRFKLDYVLPLNENGKFEAGLQSRLDREEEVFTFEQFDNETDSWVISDFFSNSMDFLRDIHSLYSTYSGKFHSLSFQAGLRGEYTLRSIDVVKDDKEYKIDRFDIFPTVHASQDLGSDQQIMASYSRRIRRPRGRDLDPFPAYRDANNYRIGNPDLEPEYIDSYEFGYQKYFGGSFIALESYYRVTKNKITRIRTLQDSIMLHTSTNLNSDYILGVELMVNYEPAKWVRLNASGNFYNYKLEGQVFNEDVEKSSNVWSTRMNATFMITPMTRFQVNGFYRGPTVFAQGQSEGMFALNLAFRQDFLNRQASLILQARDVLGTMKREYTSSDPMFYTYDYRNFESPIVTLTFSYKLNNYQRKREEREEGMDDMDDEF